MPMAPSLPHRSSPPLVPVDRFGGPYTTEGTPAHVHQRVMFFGRFWPHWGHFLMDQITRLWYVVDKEPDILIAYDGPQEISGPYAEFFRLLGIRADQLLRIQTPTTFRSIVIPECSHVPGRIVYRAFARIFDYAANAALKEIPDADAYRGKDIYLSKSLYTKRNPSAPMDVGESDIEDLMRDNGYSIVAPETLSLVEQIATLRMASSVSCISGTLPHTMMFAHDGSKLTIFRKTNKPAYRQMSVNQVRNLDVTYVDAHISLFAVGPSGPFLIDLSPNVQRYASKNGLKLKANPLRQFFVRKARFLRCAPFYFSRNFRRNRSVPLFIDGQWSTEPTAKRELFSYYLKRL